MSDTNGGMAPGGTNGHDMGPPKPGDVGCSPTWAQPSTDGRTLWSTPLSGGIDGEARFVLDPTPPGDAESSGPHGPPFAESIGCKHTGRC